MNIDFYLACFFGYWAIALISLAATAEERNLTKIEKASFAFFWPVIYLAFAVKLIFVFIVWLIKNFFLVVKTTAIIVWDIIKGA